MLISLFFFFNDTATTEIYTLSLHDALPISQTRGLQRMVEEDLYCVDVMNQIAGGQSRSEEHTSELQSQSNLVCRLLLEKKKVKGASSGDGDDIQTILRELSVESRSSDTGEG